MRQILQFSHEPVTISLLSDHNFIEVNDAFLERTGYTRAEVIGRTALALGLWEDEALYNRIGEELNANGIVKRCAIKYRSKDGNLKFGTFSAAKRDFDGQLCVVSFITDTTEHVHAQEELRRSERRFRSYIEHAADGLTILRHGGKITFSSPSVKRLLGYTPEQMLGTNYLDYVHPEDLSIVSAGVDTLRTTSRAETIAFRIRHSSGRWIFIEGTATVLPESEDDPEQTVVNWRDITQRRLAEERLRNNERRLRDIVSHAPLVINEFDAQGIMTLSEGNAVPSEGVGTAGIGHSMYDLFADSTEIKDALDGVLRGETVNTVAEVNSRWFDIWGQPVRDRDGEISGGISVSTDVTARVRAEQALEQEKEQFRVLIDNASDLILMLSRDGTMLFVSPSVEILTGHTVEEVAGRNGFELVHRDDVERVTNAVVTAFANPGSGFNLRFRINCRNGGVKRFEARGRILPGRPDLMIIEERDITEQENYETELASARDAALESSRLKSAFLANMSHEIRTPLNVVLGYVDVIADHLAEAGDHSQREYLEAATKAGRRLIQTINGILDYSKIEAGGFECKPELLNLSELIVRQVDEFRTVLSRKGVALRVIDEAPGACVMADEYCVSAALQNLIGNAVKFTDRGSVEVRQFRNQGELCIEVRDTGIGIDANFIPKLFQPFVQEDSGFSRKFEGSGLGLALTRRFLDANHARVSVVSAKGAGAVFTIRFSAQWARTTRNGHSLPTPALPRLLLVEDDPDTQQMMRSLLHNLFDLRVAASGDAVRKIIAEDAAFAAILMDISLRGKEDGFQLTRFLRSQPRFRATPIIAVTAHASVEHQRMARAAGCDAVLTKPVKRAEILSTLSNANRSSANPLLFH